MLFTDRFIRAAETGGWSLHFYESDGADGSYLCTAVELFLEQRKVGRIALVRPGIPADQVVIQLTDRANKWIAEYESREHSGSTTFGPI